MPKPERVHLRTGMGGAGNRNRRRQSLRLCGDDRRARPASSAGAPQSYCQGAHCGCLQSATGAELEIGWLPQIVQQASNQKIRPGAPGAFEASSFVNLLEVPSRLDRAEGDIHAAGNPHIQTDPANILAVAKPLADRFAELDPANAQTYAARLADFTMRWQAAMARWQTQAAP